MRQALLSLFLITFAASACGGGITINTDYDPNADFSGYQTYQWAQRTETGDDDPRVYNPITASRVKEAVNYALTAKGMREVNSSPDFYVAWHGAIEGKMSMNTMYSNYGYGYGWYGYGGAGMGTATTYVNEWDEGTLVVDIIDAGTEQLVWRGGATGTVDKGNKPPEKAQEDFNKGAVKLLESFPPGVAQESSR